MIEEFYRKNRGKNEYVSQYQINDELQSIRCKAEQTYDYNQLLGYEGSASKIHFKYYGELFRRELKFTIRTKRPFLSRQAGQSAIN